MLKRIPRPHVTRKDQSGKEIDVKNGLKISGLTSCKVGVDADESFRDNVPKDANYRVRNMEVMLRRGVQFVKTMTVTSENVDLAAWRAEMRRVISWCVI